MNQTVTPLPGSRPVYWWWNEVARLTSSPCELFLLLAQEQVLTYTDDSFTSDMTWQAMHCAVRILTFARLDRAARLEQHHHVDSESLVQCIHHLKSHSKPTALRST